MPEEQRAPLERSWRPVPDPTELTTASIIREISALKEVTFARLDAIERERARELETVSKELLLVRTIIETRLDANDKAIKILQDISDRFPDRIDEKISALKAIHEGEFASIQVQFRERDVRTDQTSVSTKVAVDAALQAAKEAVQEQNRSSALAIAKSETATDKRIDAIAGLIATTAAASDDKFSDIKERLTRIEGVGLGRIETKAETNTGSAFLVSMIGVGLALISSIIAAFALMSK